MLCCTALHCTVLYYYNVIYYTSVLCSIVQCTVLHCTLSCSLKASTSMCAVRNVKSILHRLETNLRWTCSFRFSYFIIIFCVTDWYICVRPHIWQYAGSCRCTMHYEVCSVHYALCSVQCALCTMQCALRTVHFELCTVKCLLCSKRMHQCKQLQGHCTKVELLFYTNPDFFTRVKGTIN